jgi:crotonobetainyl-CoA:carnitine CoA-transferase CaiB-like acyl-CoA transferase
VAPPGPAPGPSPTGSDSAPLAGLVVLDFTRVLAGPHCTRLLADLGARVIKIERPGEGDEMRRAHLRLPGEEDQSTYFIRRNVGKESVGLDLARPEARAVVADLARAADVAVENFVPGVAARLGCDHERLRAVRPDLVYCSISGYGQTGPWRDRGAFAHVVLAASGIMDLDALGERPRSSHLQAADVLAGTHAFGAILAALWRRARTGQGAYLDVSMLEALIAAEDVAFGAAPNEGAVLRGPRSGMGLSEVGGRWIAWQTGGAPLLWPRLAAAMGRPEMLQDPRYATPEARREHWRELEALVGAWLAGFGTAEAALAALHQARIPAAPVLSPEEVVRHPHLAARGAFPTVPHPAAGTVRVTSSPFMLDGRPVGPAGPAPYRVGEHTRAVLGDLLGYPKERIDALVTAGVAAAP